MLTESKTEILLKIGATLDRVPIEVSILNEIVDVEVDTDNLDVEKTKILSRTEKIVEKIGTLTTLDNETRIKGTSSVAKEVTISLVDEVVDTSIVETWS